MRLTKIIIGSILASLIMTALMLIMPNDKAHAINYCSDLDGKFSLSGSLRANPGAQYLGETVSVSGTLRAKEWPSGRGYFSFSNVRGNSYSQTNTTAPITRYGVSVTRDPYSRVPTAGRATIGNTGFWVYSYSKTDRNYKQSCYVSSNSKTYVAPVTILYPENIDLSWTVSRGRAWNDPVSITFTVTNKDGSGPTPQGRIDFDYSGIKEGIPYNYNYLSNGKVSVPITMSHIAFNAYDRGCTGGSIWDFIFGGNILYCKSSWYNLHNGFSQNAINGGNKYLTGHNAIAYVEFISSNRNIWNGGNEANPWNPGDKAETIWQMNSPRQSTNLLGTATGNTASIPNVSRAGTAEKQLPRLSRTCAANQTTCDGWTAQGRYGSGAYAWYALRINNFNGQNITPSSGSNRAFFLNCEPEGNGVVRFQYYDYGQGIYNPTMYSLMMNNKSQTFNLKDPSHGYGATSEIGILGGFENYRSISGDRWDIVAPISNLNGALGPQLNYANGLDKIQSWGGTTSSLGNASCGYPSPRAWVASNTTMTLPASQFVNGRYIFSTAMSIRLGSLDVRGGSGADNRTLPANPVTIQIRGPINRDVNVFCLANSNPANCIGQAVTRLNVAGDYNIRACWNGGVTGGGVHRVFTGSCSGFIPFRVYETFSCDFPETPENNITIGPDAQGQIITGTQGGTPQIIRSGDKIRVIYPNVTLANFKGLVSVPAPPAGEPQIKGRTRITDGSNPFSSSDVRLYDATGREIDANRGSSLEWNDGIEIANPVHFISYYWPSAITASGRASIQIERRIWVYATAFDPAKGATAPPDTQYWSCSSVGSRDIPHSAWIQIINSQLNQ